MSAADESAQDAETGHGPEIVAGLRQSRSAWEAGDRDQCTAIVEDLRKRYGNAEVDVVLGALRFGFITFDDEEA